MHTLKSKLVKVELIKKKQIKTIYKSINIQFCITVDQKICRTIFKIIFCFKIHPDNL